MTNLRRLADGDSGLTLDANGAEFDVTNWREALLSALQVVEAFGNSRKLVDADGNNVLVDEFYGQVGIPFEHYLIHEGKHFFVAGESVMGDTDEIDFQLTTPAHPTEIHMTFKFTSTSELLFGMYQDAVVVANGTPVTAYNNKLKSENATSLTLLQVGGDVTTSGTNIFPQRVGEAGDKKNPGFGGFTARSRELILKPETTYRFMFTSGGADNNVSYVGEWYEVED